MREILLGLVATAVALVGAELAVRCWAPVYRPAHVLDERVIYRTPPHSLSLYRGAYGDRLIRANGLGYRGPEPDGARGRIRIPVYGDSSVFAAFSDLQNTFPARLEETLHAARVSGAQVLNAGLRGYGPDQSLLLIEEEFDAFAPRIVVLALTASNDFGDLLRNGIYGLRDGQLVENGQGIHEDVRSELAAKTLLAGDSWLARSMLVRTLSKIRWERTRRRQWAGRKGDDLDERRVRVNLTLREREYRKVVNGDRRGRIGLDTPDLDVSLLPRSDSARYKVALVDAVLGRIHEVLAQRGAALALLIIPAPFDACGELENLELEGFPEYRPSNASDALVTIAEARGIPYVDLFPVFSVPDCWDFYQPKPDSHWSDLGQRVAAERMADLLLGERLLSVESGLR